MGMIGLKANLHMLPCLEFTTDFSMHLIFKYKQHKNVNIANSVYTLQENSIDMHVAVDVV